MTDCPRADMRDALPDLLSGRLDAATRTAVERHVATCEACSAELAMLRAARAAIAAPAIDVGRIARGVIEATIAPDPSGTTAAPTARGVHDVRSAPSARRAMWRAAAAIATVAVGVMGYSMLRSGRVAPRVVPIASTGGATPAPRVAPVPRAPLTTASVNPPALARTARGLVVDGGVSDLPESDLRALLQSLDSLRAEPDPNPTPIGYHIPEDTI